MQAEADTDVLSIQCQLLRFNIRILWLTLIKVIRRDDVSH